MQTDAIAIVGTGCRFPGNATTPSQLWGLLENPRDLVSKPPKERFNLNSFHRSGQESVAGTGLFLEQDPYVFDAPFFSISPVEATSMDPQQRLLMETVYEALERAGLPLEHLQGSSTGVFCGSMNQDHSGSYQVDRDRIGLFVGSGSSPSILANRVSYFFDWRGPSITMDTACSASLTAVHLAVNALQKGDCSLAVCAGSNLMLSPDTFHTMTQMQILSPTGRSHMWDDRADGYARGEGVAAVILKPLSDALRDGDEIESLIRATGANSDGRTQGLTVPNGKSQVELIRQTYARAGLNPLCPEDRCQYFEAHGTGTPVGDPQEAYAVSQAFFNAESAPDNILQVGSIKTVIGHTEAAAGVAGLIKASLAIQHGLIPPNQNFEKANPAVAPYMSHLRVPTQAFPWPELSAGVPRRASVNSFGFGGANAHVILESFSRPLLDADAFSSTDRYSLAVLPFVFSAATPDRLHAVVQRHIAFLDANPGTDLMNLAASLIMRRSNFSHRLILVANSVEELRQKLHKELEPSAANPPTIVSHPSAGSKQILGVFTGQGAQYVQMGWAVISNSPQASLWLAELQEALDTLPDEYKPKFSLVNELSAPEDSSRISTAEISQPLCTALQIIQVNVLRTLGITFAAVVGHSSGEIAAAYAAGRLSAGDAIRVAYLRGLASNHARSVDQAGGMMAVAISLEQAQAICAEEPYAGKVVISASNSPSSVTLSGDADLLQELEWLFRSLEQNPRRLQVDTAYHSYHMDPCAGPYMRAIEAAQIQTSAANAGTKWFSSVFDGQTVDDGLDITYWKENMLRPVLFQQAITAALAHLPNTDAILEVGPHPVLQGPTMQTLSHLQPAKVDDTPYIAVARRKQSGLEMLAAAVGSFWAYLGMQKLDIPAYVRLFLPERSELAFIRELPTYPWDHGKAYKALPRLAAARMHRPNPIHPLLGARSGETGEGEWRWRNYLRLQDVDWLEDHQVQSQVIFPATGYLVLAHEAARIIADGRLLQYVDIEELTIDRAITIPDDATGTEILFAIQLGTSENSSIISGHFTCQAAFGDVLRRCCSGRIRIALDEADPALFPGLPSMGRPNMRPVDARQFYRELSLLGYGYRGVFQGLSDVQRQKDAACGLITPVDHDSVLLHPVTLDLGLQSIMAAIGAPGDGQLTDILVPTYIARATINSGLCPTVSRQNPLRVECALTAMGPGGTTGDIDLFDSDGHGIVQVQGVSVAPLNTAMTSEVQFGEVIWGFLHPDADRDHTAEISANSNLGINFDRISLLYLQEIQNQLTAEDRAQLDPLGTRYVAWLDRVLSLTRDGRHPRMRPEYLQGDAESLLPRDPTYSQHIMLHAMEVVRLTVVPWLRGQASLIEALRKDNILDLFYEHNPLLTPMTDSLAEVVAQIAFRYPHMKILEVGAGTGSATREVLSRLAGRYHSYTYTDISAAFFEKAEEEFVEQGGNRLLAQILDIEQDPMAQGFPEQGYDLIIASNVLHATRSLHTTMSNIRNLLKPGGRVAILELTDPEIVAGGCIFGCFEGWWLGAEQDGRTWSPVISISQWDKLLLDSGFDALETSTGPAERESLFTSVMVARVTDERVQRVQSPLLVTPSAQYADLLIVGGATTASAPLVQPLQDFLGPYFQRTTHLEALEAFEPLDSLNAAVVLVLSDLDSPYLDNITADRLQGLQKLLPVTSKMLWVTAEDDDRAAHLNMSRILLASLRYEYPQALLQHLTIADSAVISAELVATSLLRLAHTDFKNDFRHTSLLETVETELRLEKDGVLRIPRLQRNSGMTQRLQGSRGLSTEVVDPQTTCVQICTTTNGGKRPPLLESVPPSQTFDSSADLPTLAATVRIRVHYATLPAIRIAATCFLYVVIGKEVETGKRVLALANENASFVSTRLPWARPVPAWIRDEDEAAFLKDISAAFVAEYLVQQAPSTSTVLIHEPEMVAQSFYGSVTSLASVKGVHVRFCTSSKLKLPSDPYVCHILSGTPTRTLSRQLPADVSMMVTFGSSSDMAFGRIKTLLQPLGVLQMNVDSIYQPQAVDAPETQVSAVENALSMASLLAQQTKVPRPVQDTIQPDQLSGYLPPIQRLDVVDWVHTDLVLAQTLSASSLVKLSARKTYLLVGMTGEIGQSVAQWMVERGACFVVLTSRTPNVDTRWVDEMAGLGARVLVVPMDVTDRASLLRVDEKIHHESLPHVGGVVNGAMALRDMPFAELSIDAVKETLGPKVSGSILLDELYRGPELDFFLLVSSVTGCCGNLNQSIYGAANAFMAGLVKQRQQQHEVASIIHMPQVRGLGYLARNDARLQDFLSERMGTLYLSERDLLELLAESILAGRPKSNRQPDIVGGMRWVDPVKYPDVYWYCHPLMWPLIEYSQDSQGKGTNSKEESTQIKLKSATTYPEAVGIIGDGFQAKIRRKLHLAADVSISGSTRLMELGMDSLMAVDLRLWFGKELEVDIAIIRLLGASSIDDLAASAAEQLDTSLIPNVEGTK